MPNREGNPGSAEKGKGGKSKKKNKSRCNKYMEQIHGGHAVPDAVSSPLPEAGGIASLGGVNYILQYSKHAYIQ